MNQHVKKFCDKYDITEEQYYGRKCINKTLKIDVVKIPKGFNPQTRYNLTLNNVKEISGNFSPIIGSSLILNKLKKISGNFSPVMGYNLKSNRLKEISGNFNPIIGEYLDLNSLEKISGNFSPIIGYDLTLNSLEKISGNFNPIVGGNLHMNTIKKLPSNFSITIGKDLSLNSLEKIPKNFNPVVGRDLYLKLKKLPPNFNPKVEGKILYNYDNNHCGWNFRYISEYISTNKPPSLLSWQNGKYIKVDGIFSEVIEKRGKVYKLKYTYVGYNRDIFLVTDGKDTFAHGFTIKEAKEDLLLKINKNKNLDSFKLLKLDSKISYEKAIECYRVITGACEYGTQNFIKTNSIKNKYYTIKEIIDLTKNQYGNNKFEQFFNK